ncbi:MAG: hypothetical protein Q9197_003181 [Variospora fuerteventurae]
MGGALLNGSTGVVLGFVIFRAGRLRGRGGHLRFQKRPRGGHGDFRRETLRLMDCGDDGGGGTGSFEIEIGGGRAVDSRSSSRRAGSMSADECLRVETGFSKADVFNDAEKAGEGGLGGM